MMFSWNMLQQRVLCDRGSGHLPGYLDRYDSLVGLDLTNVKSQCI